MIDRLRLLIVSYGYPRPGTSRGGAVGGERMRQLVRRLPAHGIDPIVLTHAGLRAGWLGEDLYASRDVVRCLAELVLSGRQQTGGGPREGWRVSDLRTELRRWALPDRATYAWAPFAVAAARELAATRTPDAVISSSPPLAAHLAGLGLARLWGVPWIADVRDGYSFEAPEGAVPLAPLRRVLERRLYENAACVLTVSDALSDDLRRLVPHRSDSVVTITNGYDETLFESPTEESGADPSTDVWEVLYAGSTSFRSGYSLDRLLEGVDRFALRIDREVRLKLIGLFTPSDISRRLKRARLEVTGWQPRAAVARAMQRANTLLVLTGNHSSVATTKLFEYIGAGRPVLVVGPDSAAARLLKQGDFGVVADDDADRIADALERVYRDRAEWSSRLAGPEAHRAREAFSRGAQAAQVARIVRDVVERHVHTTPASRL